MGKENINEKKEDIGGEEFLSPEFIVLNVVIKKKSTSVYIEREPIKETKKERIINYKSLTPNDIF